MVQSHDPRFSQLSQAIEKEIEGLQNKRILDIVSQNNLPTFGDILGDRFLFSIKDEGSKNKIWKAQFVVKVHKI